MANLPAECEFRSSAPKQSQGQQGVLAITTSEGAEGGENLKPTGQQTLTTYMHTHIHTCVRWSLDMLHCFQSGLALFLTVTKHYLDSPHVSAAEGLP